MSPVNDIIVANLHLLTIMLLFVVVSRNLSNLHKLLFFCSLPRL